MKKGAMIFFAALVLFAVVHEPLLARGGGRGGGGARGVGGGARGVGGARGAVRNPIQRTPSLSRVGAGAAVGFRAGANQAGGYYYPSDPYYNQQYPTQYQPVQPQPSPYALPGYNPV